MLAALVFFAGCLLLVGWLEWDRRDRRARDGEFYHTIKNAVAPVVARLTLLEVLTEQAKREIKADVKKNPDETAVKVMAAIEHAKPDSAILKNPLPPIGDSP